MLSINYSESESYDLEERGIYLLSSGYLRVSSKMPWNLELGSEFTLSFWIFLEGDGIVFTIQ